MYIYLNLDNGDNPKYPRKFLTSKLLEYKCLNSENKVVKW